jgi:hypothetical protein
MDWDAIADIAFLLVVIGVVGGGGLWIALRPRAAPEVASSRRPSNGSDGLHKLEGQQ